MFPPNLSDDPNRLYSLAGESADMAARETCEEAMSGAYCADLSKVTSVMSSSCSQRSPAKE
jgi:hypothetical protein